MLEHKTLSLNECDLKFAANEGEFSGYGSVFNLVDSKNDIIMPGAYGELLKSGQPVHVYVNHGWLRGELPIGQWNGLKEDTRGLLGNAELQMKMPSALNAYWSMKSGLVSGLSVAIIPDQKAIERRSDGVRLIHQVKILKEISIVNDPANDQSRILDVKTAEEVDGIETLRDFERFLRDAGGLSKGLTEALVSRAKVIFGQGEPGQDKIDAKAMQKLTDRLQQIAAGSS
jgi:HK97 family phage prohead protease